MLGVCIRVLGTEPMLLLLLVGASGSRVERDADKGLPMLGRPKPENTEGLGNVATSHSQPYIGAPGATQ